LALQPVGSPVDSDGAPPPSEIECAMCAAILAKLFQVSLPRAGIPEQRMIKEVVAQRSDKFSIKG
jgi:hypothetical protein